MPVNVENGVEAVAVPVEEEDGRVAGRVPVAVQQHLLQRLRAERSAESAKAAAVHV